jgi:hypothetical protein
MMDGNVIGVGPLANGLGSEVVYLVIPGHYKSGSFVREFAYLDFWEN